VSSSHEVNVDSRCGEPKSRNFLRTRPVTPAVITPVVMAGSWLLPDKR